MTFMQLMREQKVRSALAGVEPGPSFKAAVSKLHPFGSFICFMSDPKSGLDRSNLAFAHITARMAQCLIRQPRGPSRPCLGPSSGQDTIGYTV